MAVASVTADADARESVPDARDGSGRERANAADSRAGGDDVEDETSMASYALMMETMKRAMGHRRMEATKMEASTSMGWFRGVWRRGGGKARAPPTMTEAEITNALASIELSSRERDEKDLEVVEFHSLDSYVREGVLVAHGESSYALPMDIDRRVLNSYRTTWTGRVTKTPVEATAHWKKMFSVVESRHFDDKKGNVDYGAIALDDRYGEFEEATCELRSIRLNEGQLANEDARKAFLLNVYNIAVKHAFVNVGIPETPRQRSSFYGGVGYVIGGALYTLDDIEHGLLRANAPHPSNKFASNHFKDRHEAKYALSKLDPRIHFALNCGANSCPPIRAYSTSSIDAQLDLAASAFLNSTVVINEGKSSVTLSKIMSWYAKDFGNTTHEVLRFVASRLKDHRKAALTSMLASGKTPRVTYAEYDWATDTSEPRPFSLNRFVG